MVMQVINRLPNGLGLIKYVHREINTIMAESSHSTIAHMAQIREQEKFRADPRFPLMQVIERNKRYQAIFNGAPYQPIFS